MNVVVIKDSNYEVFTIAVETMFEDRYLPVISFFHRSDFERFVHACQNALEQCHTDEIPSELPESVKRFIDRLKRIDGIR